MKTILALGAALLFAVPVTAEAAQDNRRQERSFQSAERGATARAQRQSVRLQRVAARPQRQARQQQRQARPQRQARQQQRQARPQRQARQQQRQMRPDVRRAPARAARVQSRGQDQGRAAGTSRQFRRDVAPRSNRFAQNRQGRNRAAPNRQGPNRATRNRPGSNRAAPNRRNDWQRGGRFGGNRNDVWNGRFGSNRNGAFRGPGRDRYAARGPNRNGRYGYDRNWRGRYGDDRRWNRGYGGRRQFFYRGHYRPAIRVRPYHYPRGHYYTSWHIGAYLPMLFLSAQYFYDDYYQLGLTPPPSGYRWVRYGPDLLLVNLYSGEVVDVVYSAFYW